MNEPGPAFVPHGNFIRAPVSRAKGLTTRTTDAMLAAHGRGPFDSLAGFFHRVSPPGEELEAIIRAGAFHEFGETRTRQFWQAQHLLKSFGAGHQPNQGWLIAPPGLEQLLQIPLTISRVCEDVSPTQNAWKVLEMSRPWVKLKESPAFPAKKDCPLSATSGI